MPYYVGITFPKPYLSHFQGRHGNGSIGLHSSTHHIYATHESLEDGRMGAGVYIARSGKALRCRVGRSREICTSLRVETGASYLALEHRRDIEAPIFILTDLANHLQGDQQSQHHHPLKVRDGLLNLFGDHSKATK